MLELRDNSEEELQSYLLDLCLIFDAWNSSLAVLAFSEVCPFLASRLNCSFQNADRFLENVDFTIRNIAL